ncbi:MAG TPA: tetratricopeptide repeat protein [Candidatus Limnocylindria bacterium]|nr:tetratricopeptide repeat protein [Candidatus Limnocylindria bacterium]
MLYRHTDRTGPAGRIFPLAAGLALFLGFTFALSASPEGALKAYEQGDFRRARAEFERLAKEKPGDPRLRFNAGDAAYRQQDFTNATAQFETVLGAPDLKLQQQAYYNLGNTHYQLGNKAGDPQAKLQSWQQSLTNYGAAVKLDPRDTNAQSNLAFVQRQVEELMKQMPKPPPQQDQKKDDKDQQKKDQDDSQQQQAGQSKDQQKQDQKDQKDQQDQKGQQPKNQQAQKPDQQKDSESSQKQDQKEQAKADEKKEEQQAQKQEGQQAGEKSPGSQGEPQAAEAGKPGEMNAAQAGRMLDEQKGDEKALVFQASGSGKDAAERARKNRKKW